VRTSSGCRSLEKRDGGYRVLLENQESIPADAVIVACESFQSARLLSATAPEISRRLLEIPTPPVALVALGYGPEAVSSIPRGFGLLIPREAGYRALGVTCDGYLFPGRNREGHLLVRLFFGGTFDPGIEAMDGKEVERTAVSEMKRLFSVETEPRFVRSLLWPRAIPQYELGHGTRVVEIEKELSRFPSLYLAGNSLHGPSFGRAAARGASCGRASVEALIRGRAQEVSS
jgi:oxygen-dependent protoporphyrinogen oxidase